MSASGRNVARGPLLAPSPTPSSTPRRCYVHAVRCGRSAILLSRGTLVGGFEATPGKANNSESRRRGRGRPPTAIEDGPRRCSLDRRQWRIVEMDLWDHDSIGHVGRPSSRSRLMAAARPASSWWRVASTVGTSRSTVAQQWVHWDGTTRGITVGTRTGSAGEGRVASSAVFIHAGDDSGFCCPGVAGPVCRQPADFSLMRSSTAFGMVVSKSRSLAQVGVIVMTTISS